MTMMIDTPHRFKERILLFGGGGVGKTNSALTIASHTTSQMYVIETDYSAAYDRALATDFTECEDRVTVEGAADWPEFIALLEKYVDTADPDEDWITIDSCSPCTYDWVQQWTIEQTYGSDLPKMLRELKAASKTAAEFAAAKSDLMQWDIVKKEYNKMWGLFRRWKGHLLLTAEAKAVDMRREKDEDLKRLYGPLGFFPAGQNNLRHATSTTIFLDHPGRDVWRMTAIKDRNREEADKEQVEDFALDYLVQYGGWGRSRPQTPQGKGR